MEESIRIIHDPGKEAKPEINDKTLFFGTRARRNALVNDDIPLDAALECAQSLGGIYGGQEPEDNPANAVVFLGRHPELQKTISVACRMAEKGTKLMAVSLYTPRCLDFLPDSVFKICIWQYDELAIQALIRKWKTIIG